MIVIYTSPLTTQHNDNDDDDKDGQYNATDGASYSSVQAFMSSRGLFCENKTKHHVYRSIKIIYFYDESSYNIDCLQKQLTERLTNHNDFLTSYTPNIATDVTQKKKNL